MALKVMKNEVDGWDVVREDEDAALSNHPTREEAIAAAEIRSDEERDIVGAALGLERLLARVVGQCDQDHHGEQDESRDQAAGRRTAAAPVETQLVPRRHHVVSLDRYAAP